MRIGSWMMAATTAMVLATAGSAQQAPQPLSATNFATRAAMTPPDDTPTFADEFTERRIDPARWWFDTRRNKEGWYNGEKQYYSPANTPANARIENGALVIEARHEKPTGADSGGQAYTSARMVTTAAMRYGFYEIRAKLPCGRGIWPAIWMVPPNGRWPETGEIDILELVGSQPGVIHATLHSGDFNHAKGTQRGGSLPMTNACGKWHRYQLDWTPQAITIGVDGQGYMRVANTRPGDEGAWPYDKPFNLILNVAVGGGWAGSKGIDDAAFPQSMKVDYVRYWQYP